MITFTPVVQINTPPGFIDLGIGDPPLSLLPHELLHWSTNACFTRKDPAFLQYGAEQGNGYFRQALAVFLTAGYGVPVDPASLFVTSGASSALDLICTLLTRPGDTIFVEEPSYFLALRIFSDHGLRVISIPTDENGLVVEALQDRLKTVNPKLLYVIPTYQNPAGITLSYPRRQWLSELSQEFDFPLITDEVYHLLQYGSPPPQPMAAWVGSAPILSIGSFSKILAPGLRLGWIQANSSLIHLLTTCGLLDSGGGMNPFTSAIVREALENGEMESNLTLLKSIYGKRLAAMDGALHHQLPQAEYNLPQGGYFIWVKLPGLDLLTLQEKARSFQVGFRPGIRFSSQGGMSDFARLSFVHYDELEIEQGLLRLKECLQNQL